MLIYKALFDKFASIFCLICTKLYSSVITVVARLVLLTFSVPIPILGRDALYHTRYSNFFLPISSLVRHFASQVSESGKVLLKTNTPTVTIILKT